MPERDDDNILLRWSRRKRGQASEADAKANRGEAVGHDAGARAPEQPTPDDDGREPDVGASAQVSEPEAGANETVPAELSDVDIDSLDYDSDYTRFMKDGVPEALKRRALRQLWRSDPILANVDGLNDYDGDFTDAAMVVDVLKTVHKVGRGYLEDDEDDVDVDDLEIDDGESTEDVSEPDVVAADNRDADDEVALRSEDRNDEAEPVEPSADDDAEPIAPNKPA